MTLLSLNLLRQLRSRERGGGKTCTMWGPGGGSAVARGDDCGGDCAAIAAVRCW